MSEFGQQAAQIHSAIRCSAQDPWTDETHPLSAFNYLNSTRLNSSWTNVLVLWSVASIDCPRFRRQNPAGKLTAGPECPPSTMSLKLEPMPPVGKEDENGLQDWSVVEARRGVRVEGGPLFFFQSGLGIGRRRRELEKVSKTSGHLFRLAIGRPMLGARCLIRRHGWLRICAHPRPLSLSRSGW